MARYDAIVLGLGAMGSAALYHLARRGRRVLGLDRFDPAHDRGSSHGRSRIIREAYWEHPAYVPLVQRAYELWEELELAAGRLILLTTGGLNLGLPESPLIRGAVASARLHGLAHEILEASDVRRRFPVFGPPAGTVAVYEPRAGVLFPEEGILAHLREATRAGAEIHHEEPIAEWMASPHGVEVFTPAGRYEAGALVVTPGPWAPEVLRRLDLPLVIERQVVAWFRPVADADAFEAGRCPVFIWQIDARLFYGVPRLGDEGVKIAEHALGDPTTADGVRRTVGPEEIEEIRRDFIAPYLPAANGEALATTVCLYTMTPDTHFIIDRHPHHDGVVFACGFSGHGFKFAPVVGEILTDLVVGDRTRHDIFLFAVDRLARA